MQEPFFNLEFRMKNLKLKQLLLFQILTFGIFTNLVYAQVEEVKCQLVLKGSVDTVHKNIMIKRSGSNNKGMAFSNVLGKKLVFKKSNGETEKICIKEVDRLEFTDFHGIPRVFIDEPQVRLGDDKDNLVEEVHRGTTSLNRSQV